MTTSPFDVKLVEVGFRGLSGSPGIVPRGAWLNTTVYVRNDVVTYLGASWRALAGSTGVAPDSDAGKWEVFVQRGAQGPSFAPGEAIIVFVDGQSNAVLRRAFSWSPPPNLWEWNNNGGAMTLGTAWVKPDGTIISWPLAIGAEIARRFPANPVYILTEARGSSAMVHWLPGIPYTWSSSTSVADPGTGKIAINNATPGSATTLSVSETASDGKFRYYWLFSLLLNTGRIRVSKASDPTVYVEYTEEQFLYRRRELLVAAAYLLCDGGRGCAGQWRCGPAHVSDRRYVGADDRRCSDRACCNRRDANQHALPLAGRERGHRELRAWRQD
jgi:hypothetical protein